VVGLRGDESLLALPPLARRYRDLALPGTAHVVEAERPGDRLERLLLEDPWTSAGSVESAPSNACSATCVRLYDAPTITGGYSSPVSYSVRKFS